MKKLKRGERQTTLTGFRANYTLAEIAYKCGVSDSAIWDALQKIERKEKPNIILHVNKKNEVTDAYEADYRQKFKFRFKKHP